MDTGTLRAKVHIDEALRYLGAGAALTERESCGTERAVSDSRAESRGEQAGVTADGSKDSETPLHTLYDQVQRAAEQVEAACKARFTYRVFELEHDDGTGAVSCLCENGSRFELPGRDIAEVLRESHHCIIMAATIGGEVDRLIRRLSVKGMADAVIADACASSAIEGFSGSINEFFRRKAADAGAFLTDRYSPGYGDLDIGFQLRIAGLLQTEKRIGLTVSDTCMMTPMKSVTAIIGIADRPQPKRVYGCRYCDLKDRCRFRKAGTTCSE